MARNGSGTYIPPAGNPVVPGTVIQSGIFNSTISDIGAEITNSLPIDGQSPMTGVLKVQDGSQSTPGLAFNGESSSGFYRAGTGDVRLSVSGVQAFKWTSTGALAPMTLTVTGATTLSSTLGVAGATTLGGTLAITGATTISNNLSVAGSIVSSSTLYAPNYWVGGNVSTDFGSFGLTSDKGPSVAIFGNASGGAGTLSLLTGGAYRLNIDQTGNVGIGFSGTSTVAYKLGVNGTILSNAGYRVLNSDSTSGGSIVANTGTANGITIGSDGGPMVLQAGGAERLRINGTGDLLVGTTSSPYAQANRGLVSVNGQFASMYALQVNSLARGYMYSDGNSMHVVSNQGPLCLGASGDIVQITTNGLVGFGTSTPAALVSVNGAIHSSGSQTTHSQGAYIEWNKVSGTGETDFVNQRGGGAGGFNWYETDTANNLTMRMQIDGNGSVGVGNFSNPSAYGTFAVVGGSTDFSVRVGQESGNATYIGTTGAKNIVLMANGTPRLGINTAGTVNINGNLTLNSQFTRFESGAYSLAASGNYSAAHGGSRKPDIIRAVARCNSSDATYAPGDEVNLESFLQNGSTIGVSVWSNASVIGATTYAVGYVPNKSSAGYSAVTFSNWSLVFYGHWL